MMVAVQMDNQTLFDSLWRWAVTHMRHNKPTDARYGLFAWHCNPNGGGGRGRDEGWPLALIVRMCIRQ